MFNIDEFTSALASGTSSDDIAKAFTETLNQAVKVQKEKEEKEKAAALAKSQRVNALDDIVEDIQKYIQKYYPNYYDEKVFKELDTETLDESIESSVKQFAELGKFAATIKVNSKTADDLVERFFKEFDI